jgi:trk system potassium uptake protein TrkA
MGNKRYVIMGAGEVGCHLARTLSAQGHRVTVIDNDPAKRQIVEEQLDAGFVQGNGANLPTLEAARVDGCELFVAASSSDEANLAASLLAKHLGAPRTVVRVASSEDVTRFGRTYESTFKADLLLSTQLLTTTQILNSVLGYNTKDVEYLAGGAIQIRKTRIEAGSLLNEKRLADVNLPEGSLVLAYITQGVLKVPSGNDRAEAGAEAIILGTTSVIGEVERRVSGHSRKLGQVVIAGGGHSAAPVAAGLVDQAKTIKIIESDRQRAQDLASKYPDYEIRHGDATDMATLNAEGVENARAFIAMTGHDESNLMACLLARELGVGQIAALVQKSETSHLWQKIGMVDVVSPRSLAAERIQNYIESNYEPHIVSFENGAAQFMQRRVVEQSPAAGNRLENVEIPQGLIVAAILHDGKAIVPRGGHKLEVGDEVILFVSKAEVAMAQLVFPGTETP